MPWPSLLVAPPRGSLEGLRLHVAGKTVLITGASYGVGEASARLFAASGAEVLLLARSAERLQAVAGDIARAGGKATVYAVDLSDWEALDQCLERIQAAHPRIDLAICNAGRSARREIAAALERHDLEKLVQINYLSPARLIAALLPRWLEQGGAQIVSVSAVSALLMGFPMWAAYQSSKTGFDVWLQSLAAELEPRGLRVSTVYLPLVRTRMSQATRAFDQAPALSAAEAAEVIAFAVISGRPRVGPWWLWLAHTVHAWSARGPRWLLSRLFLWSLRRDR